VTITLQNYCKHPFSTNASITGSGVTHKPDCTIIYYIDSTQLPHRYYTVQQVGLEWVRERIFDMVQVTSTTAIYLTEIIRNKPRYN